MSIGERISELRTQNNMSQYELAKAMDVSRQAVSKWENDQTCPDAMNLIRLSEILDRVSHNRSENLRKAPACRA